MTDAPPRLMQNLPPRCEAQIGVRPRLRYNAFISPMIVLCPRSVKPGTRFCQQHQPEEHTDD